MGVCGGLADFGLLSRSALHFYGRVVQRLRRGSDKAETASSTLPPPTLVRCSNIRLVPDAARKAVTIELEYISAFSFIVILFIKNSTMPRAGFDSRFCFLGDTSDRLCSCGEIW